MPVNNSSNRMYQLKRDARSRDWYPRKEQTLARKIVEALGYDWLKVDADYQDDDFKHRSYFGALDRCYPHAPIRMEWSGLRLSSFNTPPLKLFDGMEQTFAYRAYRELQGRSWALDQYRGKSAPEPVGCIFRHRDILGPVVIHNLRPGRVSVTVHHVEHRIPELSGPVFFQTFRSFLRTLAAVASAAVVGGTTAFDRLAQAIVELITRGAHIEGLTDDSGGKAVGRIHRGKLLLEPAALPSHLTTRSFLRQLDDNLVIKSDRSSPGRETFYRRCMVNGVSTRHLELTSAAFAEFREMLETAKGAL